MRLALAAILAVVAVPVVAAELPARKPGLWVTTLPSAPGQAPRSIEFCLDAATDARIQAGFGNGLGAGQCSRRDITRTANGFVIDSVCDFGQGPVGSRAEIVGDFQSEYAVKVESKGMPPVTMRSKWAGVCGDLRPGEARMEGGMKLDLTRLSAK